MDFFQLITEHTRNKNILDHIYSNNINKINRSYIEVDSSSDHRYIIVEKIMKINQTEENYIITRNFKILTLN